MENLEKKQIYSSLASVMNEVGYIGKNRKNAEQNYKFRGIDDVYNTLHDLFAKNNIIIMPQFVESKREERQSKNGGVLIYTVSTYDFEFISTVDGSRITSRVQGEGMDKGDKSLNKSFSGAMKYALLSMFIIPTDELRDSEEDSHEVTNNVTPIKIAQKQPMPSDRFVNMMNKVMGAESIEQAKDYIAMARKNFVLTDKQEDVIARWIEENMEVTLK